MQEEAQTRVIREDVFGDESVIGGTAVYGLVAFPADRVEPATGLLDSLKLAAKVPTTARVHCRELVHSDCRRKSPWAQLTDDEVWQLLDTVSRCFAPVGARFHVGVLDKSMLPPDLRDEHGAPLGMRVGDKEAVWLAYMTATVALDQYVGFNATRLWVDPDSSLMQFFGKRKQVRHAFGQVFRDASGRVAQAQPEPISGPKPALLEVADVLAYSSAQAISRQASRHKERCRTLMAKFSPSISCMIVDDDGFLRVGVGPDVFAVFQERRRRLFGATL